MFGLHEKTAGGVERAAGHFVAGVFFHGERLAGNHGFVNGGFPVEQDAVHRNFLAGTDAQFCSGLNGFKRHITFFVVLNNPCCLRREIQQGTDGAAGFAPCPQFKDLTEQHQHNDHRRRLEINSDLALRRERSRKRARHEHHRRAEQEGCAHANGDEREHIQMPGDERTPAAFEKRPARP